MYMDLLPFFLTKELICLPVVSSGIRWGGWKLVVKEEETPPREVHD
jgi:hypothetical protein